jgi:sugar lactone lactonase YvrE
VISGWLLFFAGAHLLFVSIATLIAALRRERGACLLACLALAGLAAISLLSSMTSSGAYLLITMLREIKEMHGGSVVAVGLGLSTAAPWLLFPFSLRASYFPPKKTLLLFYLGISLASIAPAVAAIAYRDYRDSLPNPHYKVPPRSFDPRFSVDNVASFADSGEDEAVGAYPICVAVDENDNVFVSLQLKGEDDYSGRIFQLMPDQGSDRKMRLRTVADSPCLFRTFGLALRGGEIFVSRSGFLARANKGRIEYANSGAITRLRDLDRDGVMDYYEDMVVDLPGSQGPVSQHSNNAITFGPDGSLYFTQGVHSDRDVLNHPWEGKILRASPNFQKVTIFASGLRNPFGLVFGPDRQLFATDNDVTLGNPGDELNLIKEGADYGHPYVVGDDDGGGQFVRPLLLEDKGSFGGMTYTESNSLPPECRGCLYIADFIGNRIWRVTLARHGDCYTAKAMPFVEVPSPIGIAVTRTGVFFITSYEGFVFRVRTNDKART